MNLRELRAWAYESKQKDNMTLISEGVIDKQLPKVRAFVNGIIERCDYITAATEKNNTFLVDIENYLKHLKNYGLDANKANPKQIEGKDGNKSTERK